MILVHARRQALASLCARLRPVVGAGLLGLLFCLLSASQGALVAQGADLTRCPLALSPHERFGVNVSLDNQQTVEPYAVGQLHAGWHLDYTVRITPTQPADLDFVQLLRSPVWRSPTFTATVAAVAAANPGDLWLVGNEPDRSTQDALTPAEYATFYHDAYALLKTLDPSSRVAAGGVVQATPLRLRYLDMVLAEYERRYGSALPADLWHIHGFVLPECNTAGCWGASIPPGLAAFASEGKRYSVGDHDELDIFKEQIVAFRQWMAAHGYRDKPLIVSEYGILLSPQHGFPYPKVRDFMRGSFDFLLNTMNAEMGYPADEDRLVQGWSWFSLNHPPYDPATRQGFNGNLFDPVTLQILPLGQDFAAYTAPLVRQGMDLAVTQFTVQPPSMLITATPTVSLTVTLVNRGNVAARNIFARLWLGDPNAGGVLIQQSPTFAALAVGCQEPIAVHFQWQPSGLAAGAYHLVVDVQAEQSNPANPAELDLNNNLAQQEFFVRTESSAQFSYLPLVRR